MLFLKTKLTTHSPHYISIFHFQISDAGMKSLDHCQTIANPIDIFHRSLNRLLNTFHPLRRKSNSFSSTETLFSPGDSFPARQPPFRLRNSRSAEPHERFTCAEFALRLVERRNPRCLPGSAAIMQLPLLLGYFDGVLFTSLKKLRHVKDGYIRSVEFDWPGLRRITTERLSPARSGFPRYVSVQVARKCSGADTENTENGVHGIFTFRHFDCLGNTLSNCFPTFI